MKKMLMIVNPVAGKKKVLRYVAEIVNLFNRAGYVVLVHITERAGDGKAQLLRHAKELDLVVCCGGDGTFNEVVSGILDCGEDIPVGYIPAGSTNDFANTLGLSTNPIKAAERILQGAPTPVDVGTLGNARFTYIASFGAFTRASYNTPQNAKNTLGHTAYLLEGLTELSQIRKIRVKAELDEETVEGEYIFGAVCNSTSVAGVLKLDPRRVDLQDGRFEVLLIRAPKDLAELSGCIHALSAQTYDSPMITFRSSRNVTITTPEKMTWSLDGEGVEGDKTVQIRNLRQAIRIVM